MKLIDNQRVNYEKTYQKDQVEKSKRHLKHLFSNDNGPPEKEQLLYLSLLKSTIAGSFVKVFRGLEDFERIPYSPVWVEIDSSNFVWRARVRKVSENFVDFALELFQCLKHKVWSILCKITKLHKVF